jgi:hypothetical protein
MFFLLGRISRKIEPRKFLLRYVSLISRKKPQMPMEMVDVTRLMCVLPRDPACERLVPGPQDTAPPSKPLLWAQFSEIYEGDSKNRRVSVCLEDPHNRQHLRVLLCLYDLLSLATSDAGSWNFISADRVRRQPGTLQEWRVALRERIRRDPVTCEATVVCELGILLADKPMPFTITELPDFVRSHLEWYEAQYQQQTLATATKQSRRDNPVLSLFETLLPRRRDGLLGQYHQTLGIGRPVGNDRVAASGRRVISKQAG